MANFSALGMGPHPLNPHAVRLCSAGFDLVHRLRLVWNLFKQFRFACCFVDKSISFQATNMFRQRSNFFVPKVIRLRVIFVIYDITKFS